MNKLVDLGFYIGISGENLVTKDSCDIVKLVPIEKLMLMTLSPNADVRTMHFGGWYLKSKFLRKDPNKYQPGTTGDINVVVRYRNEPCMIVQIVEIVAYLRRVQVATIINACNKSSLALFKYET